MAITEIPTETDDSLGRDKQDLYTPPSRDHYVWMSEWNTVKQSIAKLMAAVGVDDGSTPGSLRASAGAAAPYWEWNGTDTTQFDGTAAHNSASWDAELSVEADANVPGGNLLVIESATGTGIGCGVVLATDSLPEGTTRFVVALEIQLSPTDSGYAGVALFADDDPTYHGLHFLTGYAGWTSRVDAGSELFTGSTPAFGMAVDAPALFAIEVVGDKVALVAPRFGAVCRVEQNGTNNAVHLTQLSFGTAGGYASNLVSSWQSVDPRRFGLVIQAGAGADAPTAKIRRFAILPHPLDY